IPVRTPSRSLPLWAGVVIPVLTPQPHLRPQYTKPQRRPKPKSKMAEATRERAHPQSPEQTADPSWTDGPGTQQR
ncbi:Hypothetical predicted protein, partial [Pelobates cultripes]